MVEAITGLFDGSIDYPKYDPNNLPEFGIKCDDFDVGGFYADVSLECQVRIYNSKTLPKPIPIRNCSAIQITSQTPVYKKKAKMISISPVIFVPIFDAYLEYHN